MSAAPIIQRLLATAWRRAGSRRASGEETLLVPQRPRVPATSNLGWQPNRRYVKSLERRSRKSGDPSRAQETWLFALLVSTCPKRFAMCQTEDWANAERLARTPWQRHLVRQGARLRAHTNERKHAHGKRIAARESISGRLPRRLRSDGDRVRLIRVYTAIARRLLDLADPHELQDSGVKTADVSKSHLQDLAWCEPRRHAPASGPPPGRRVRSVGTSRTRRGGHGGSSHAAAGATVGPPPAASSR